MSTSTRKQILRPQGGQDMAHNSNASSGAAAQRRAKTSLVASPKGERTRAAIIAAARTVFERDGYFDASISDIVHEASIARGSYYTYFATKREAFLAVADEVYREIDAAVAHAPGDPVGAPLIGLLNVNARFFQAHRTNSAVMNLIEQVSANDPEIKAQCVAERRRHHDRVATILMRMQSRGVASIAGNVRTAAASLITMLASAAYWAAMCPEDFVGVEETVTLIWARAIGMESTSITTSQVIELSPDWESDEAAMG